MGKSSIELTLKQLIDLGIINLKKPKVHKKRKKRVAASDLFRKRKGGRGSVPKENQQTNEAASSVVLGSKGYSTPFHLPVLQPNSDSLRLRDDNQNLNTRLLEYQQQLAIANQEADDFQDRTKKAFLHLVNSMSVPATSLGYSEDDSNGAFAASEGSDSFKSMRSTEPYIEEIDTPIKQSGFDDVETPRSQGVFSNLVFGGGYRGISTPSTGAFASPAFVRRYKRESDQTPAERLNFTTPKTSGKRVTIQTENDEEQNVATRPVETPDQPVIPREVPSAEFDHVERSAKKPTNAEITQWKAWYTKLAGGAVDRDILSSKKRSVIEPAVIELLMQKYQNLGGKNKIVLSSKNAKEIARNIEQLEQLKAIF